MSHQTITRSERITLFLREYYVGNSPWLNVIRIIGGPLIIGSGIHLYAKSARFAIGYGGFCFLYGIYYTLKPALIIAVRYALFQSISFDLQVAGEELTIKEAGASMTLQFDLFKSVLRNTNYYSVKLPGKMTIYFKTSLLNEFEKAVLDRHLTA